MKKTNTPRLLMQVHPDQFAGPHIGIAFYKGWFPIFARLSNKLEYVGAGSIGFHWTQVKQKYGVGCFYWSYRGNPEATVTEQERARLVREIDALVDEAEHQTAVTCIACGAPGSRRQKRGYFLTLCDEHDVLFQRDEVTDFWYGPDE